MITLELPLEYAITLLLAARLGERTHEDKVKVQHCRETAEVLRAAILAHEVEMPPMPPAKIAGDYEKGSGA